MILHVILLILLFFFVVRDQVLAPFLDKLDVDLISVPETSTAEDADKTPETADASGPGARGGEDTHHSGRPYPKC